jgi:SNF family Na+-dependent transporter
VSTIGAAVGLASIWQFPTRLAPTGAARSCLLYPLGLALIVFPLINMYGKCRHKEIG